MFICCTAGAWVSTESDRQFLDDFFAAMSGLNDQEVAAIVDVAPSNIAAMRALVSAGFGFVRVNRLPVRNQIRFYTLRLQRHGVHVIEDCGLQKLMAKLDAIQVHMLRMEIRDREEQERAS